MSEEPSSDDGEGTSSEADGTSGGVSVEHRSAEEAFALLGNETRIDIMRALAESPEEPLSFSELRERVDARDSGQFNYHLGKLTDHFVRKTGEGYRLTVAGIGIVGALRAGRYTAAVSIDPIELDDPCPRCGGTVGVTYEDEHVVIRCRDCEEFGNQFPFPPGTIEQFDREDLPEAFDRWLATTVKSTLAGFCPNCSGRVEGRLDPDDERSYGVSAVYTCERCGDVAQFAPPAILFNHPAAQAFYYDHGMDTTTTPSWKIDRRSDTSVDLVSTAPPSVRIEVRIDGDRLVATVDETASIESIERDSAR
jgi:DNA-binding transcriptional ArsR family regulator/predicted RNA-binding Zn-ribbon protein involved in translation (DUF1610 family)